MENYDVKVIISYAKTCYNVTYRHRSFKRLAHSFLTSCNIVLGVLNILNIFQILTGRVL